MNQARLEGEPSGAGLGGEQLNLPPILTEQLTLQKPKRHKLKRVAQLSIPQPQSLCPELTFPESIFFCQMELSAPESLMILLAVDQSVTSGSLRGEL